MTTSYGRGRQAALALLPLLALAVLQAHAEDGYDLWLRYHPIPDESLRAHYKQAASEIVAQHLPGARVVKAFNTLAAPVLASDPRQSGGQRVMFMSGMDPDADAQGDRHVYASRTRFIPNGLLGLFDKRAWPTMAPDPTTTRSDGQRMRVDVGARMRSMWR